MEMDATQLMEKLDGVVELHTGSMDRAQNMADMARVRLSGTLEVVRVVRQHLDHAEEIQAQEDAAAREQEQVPIGTKVYLSAGVIESGDPGYLRRGHDVYFLSAMPSTVHTRDDFSHLDDDGEPGVTDGGVA